MKKLTIEFVKAEFEKEGYVLLSKKYKNNEQKLKYICLNKHNHSITWANWYKGVRCPYCAGNKKLTIEIIRKDFKKRGYNLLTVKYKGNKQKLKFICPNNHHYQINWHDWQSGIRCAYCEGNAKLTIEFIRKEFAKEGYKLLSTTYKNCAQKLKFTCAKGHNHSVSWNKWQQGDRCLFCKESKGEGMVASFLDENNIKYERQKRFDDCRNKKPLPFDFYISDFNMLIEYDGMFHYVKIKGIDNDLKAQQYRDKIKTKYASKNNIKLLRIPYWEFNNIEEILKKELEEK